MSSSSRMTSISLGDEEILNRLGFGEGEIEILEFKNVPINKIRKEYKNSLNGYGISDISLRQIIDADELKDLIQTNIEKKDVANDVFHNINNEMDRGQGVKRKTRTLRRRTNKRKTLRRRTNKRK